MATHVRGRSGYRTRSRTSRYPVGTDYPGFVNWNRTNPKCTTNRSRGTTTWNVPHDWKGCSDSLVRKINAYRTLYNQTKGPARFDRPTPATINNFAQWISKGANIQTVTAAQVSRWARNTRKNFSTRTANPTTCKNVLWAKFGRNTIKAVARTKSGSFMVVTAPVVNGKPFHFPK